MENPAGAVDLDKVLIRVQTYHTIKFTRMTELTKEYFDKALKAVVAPLTTKAELTATEKRVIKRIDEAQEELARMTAEGFFDVQNRLDVREVIHAHERKFKKLEEALHIHL